MRIKLIISIACTSLILLILASSVTLASPPRPSGPPDLPPPSGGSSGGSSGGGSSGGTYTPPAFNPYSLNVTSSDGKTMGSINVKDYYLSTVQSNCSLGSGNNSCDVGFMADMSSVPSSPRLDILPVSLSNTGLPLDSDLFTPLAAFSLTRSSSGGEWPMKDGTVSLSLKMPLDLLSGMNLNSEFYLLKDDGTGFVVYAVMPVVQEGMAIFNVPLWYESQSPSTGGTFTLAGPKAVSSAAVTPTPIPTPVPATPTPKSGSNASVFLLIAALGIAAISLSRGKKQ